MVNDEILLEIKEKLQDLDEITFIETLGISIDELIEKFDDKIDDNLEELLLFFRSAEDIDSADREI